jgi:hypothetical protein
MRPKVSSRIIATIPAPAGSGLGESLGPREPTWQELPLRLDDHVASGGPAVHRVVLPSTSGTAASLLHSLSGKNRVEDGDRRTRVWIMPPAGEGTHREGALLLGVGLPILGGSEGDAESCGGGSDVASGANAKLGEDAADVVLDRFCQEEEALGDLGVPPARQGKSDRRAHSCRRRPRRRRGRAGPDRPPPPAASRRAPPGAARDQSVP